MKILSTKHLKDYWERFPETEQPLKAWLAEAQTAVWKTPQDIKSKYGTASIVTNNRVVFNIKANNHRLIVGVGYKFGWVYIKFIDTHAEYDKVDATTVEMN